MNPNRSFEELDSTLTSNCIRAVVPARAYSERTLDRPLDGVRIAIKDMFDLQGTRTSICSRAWLELQNPAQRTASCIQRLIDLGAIVVGKMKLQAWIIREESLECVEFIAPFNPRGDGYQSTSGSSNGSAATMGAYPWLDFAIGSDSKPLQYRLLWNEITNLPELSERQW